METECILNGRLDVVFNNFTHFLSDLTNLAFSNSDKVFNLIKTHNDL